MLEWIKCWLMYRWSKLGGRLNCDQRGKVARYITRNVKTKISDVLNEVNKKC